MSQFVNIFSFVNTFTQLKTYYKLGITPVTQLKVTVSFVFLLVCELNSKSDLLQVKIVMTISNNQPTFLLWL
jgi:hypothetical protein